MDIYSSLKDDLSSLLLSLEKTSFIKSNIRMQEGIKESKNIVPLFFVFLLVATNA